MTGQTEFSPLILPGFPPAKLGAPAYEVIATALLVAVTGEAQGAFEVKTTVIIDPLASELVV